MFDHVKFGVRDFQVSKGFYQNALKPLGITGYTDWPPLGIEIYDPEGDISLCFYQSAEKTAHLHIAFIAKSRQQVDEFYSAALQAGGKDNGKPGLRPNYHESYYAAFVIDPDGHNIEAVCHFP
ncbi:VOC family protein [Reinekea forsetii]|nr:VOC family protein [Reinekea forsetii]